MKVTELKQCKFCKKDFTPKRKWQKFCSDLCRKEHWETLNPRIKLGG